MLPYLIAGAIGFGIAKLFESDEAPKYADGGSVLLAPNGKPSNLTPEQYKLVRTKAFKDWFGDWENDPENSSKIIDENGEPLVVWHGTRADKEFNVFDKELSNNGMFYFSKSKYYSFRYFSRGEENKSFNLRPFFLNVRKILDGTQFFFDKHTKTKYIKFFKGILDLEDNRILKVHKNLRFWQIIRYADNLEDSLVEKGYDGISFYENNFMTTKREDTDQWTLGFVVFQPNQIKLADGSNTTFDGSNPDIRYAGGGKIKKVKFDIDDDEEEERVTISIKGIGKVILAVTYPEYEFLEDIGEDGLEELGVEEGDMIGKIEHLEINDKYKGQGYAKLLMNKAIEIAEEKGLMPLYLNASPMGSNGLDINDLTAFYESFGFEVFLEQGNNNLMILK